MSGVNFLNSHLVGTISRVCVKSVFFEIYQISYISLALVRSNTERSFSAIISWREYTKSLEENKVANFRRTNRR